MAQVIVKGLRKMYHDDVSTYLLNLQRALRINRMYSKTIYVNFKRSVDGDAIGYCSGDKNEVEIELSKEYSFTDLMLALAHEMVHAKQFFRGELTDGYKWKGRNYWNCAYKHQPWEKSAYYHEMKLYKECWSQNNAKNMHVFAKKHCTFV